MPPFVPRPIASTNRIAPRLAQWVGRERRRPGSTKPDDDPRTLVADRDHDDHAHVGDHDEHDEPA
jgi:hypothetical protein